MNETARVHVSLAELRTAASRALAGAGAPPGTERDGARSVVWLESRGLGGAAALLHDLAKMAGTGCRAPAVAGCRVDFAGCPALVWSSTAIELAMLEAEIAIVLHGCDVPRALVPEAAAQAEHGWRFRFWSGASRALVAEGEISLDRAFAAIGNADVTLVARAGRPSAGAARAPVPSRACITETELEARHATSLANGLRLVPGEWRAIREAAGRIFVPASERSRSRGAGAEVDDNQ